MSQGIFWVEERRDQPHFPVRRKRKNQAKKIEFIDWGSKPLVEFLKSIGIGSDKKLSQNEVSAIVIEYINSENLINPQKKKRVSCDGRLRSLFGKKSVPRLKISDLLEPHFAENQDDDSDDDFPYSSEEEGVLIASRASLDKKPLCQKTKLPEAPRSCFAAVIPDNIKLVYLKRSLVQDLAKDPKSFGGKVVGSFVRIKSDPNDYMQKYSHQLQLVTGVGKASGAGDSGTEIYLQVSNFFKDIPIHMLSDDNLSEEECEDLQDRVKNGLLKRPTVAELELKAQMLHEDITKHWIEREIALLQKLIDRANEKGWRRELFEYLERKKLLQKKSEQERLLKEIPKVIPEQLEIEPTLEDVSEKKGGNASPKSILRVTSDILNVNEEDQGADGSQQQSTSSPVIARQSYPEVKFIDSREDNSLTEISEIGRQCFTYMQLIGSGENESTPENPEIDHQSCRETQFISLGEKKSSKEMPEIGLGSCGYMQSTDLRENKSSQEKPEKHMPPEVIELSDSESDKEDLQNPRQIANIHQELAWHYLDPQGNIQGLFSMNSLKRWSDAGYFAPGFRVWKTGQSPSEAMLLVDLLRQFFQS